MKFFKIIFLLFFLIFLFMAKDTLAQSGVTSSFNPETVTAGPNQDFTVNVRLNASSALKVRMYQINVNFDPTKAQVKSINYKVGRQSDALGGDSDQNLTQINSSGQIKLIGELAAASPFVLPQGVSTSFAEIVFTSRSADQYKANISSSSFLKNVKADLILETLSVSPSLLTVNQTLPSPSPSPSVTPPPATTACFFLDDKPIIGKSCTDAGARIYDTHPKVEPLILTTAGKKTVFVRFVSNLGVTRDFQRVLNFTPDPKLTDVSCTHSLSGSGSVVNITGTALGPRGRGKVKVAGTDADIVTWNDTTGVISATLDKRLEGKSDVEVTRNDGKTARGECIVGTTSVVFAAKSQCKSGNFAADNVSVKIFANAPATVETEKPDPVIDEKIKLDKDGKPAGFTPKLEKDKKYSLIIKAAGTLAKRVDFETKGGTKNLDVVNLLTGDIAPAQNPDGKINAFDRSELTRQWSLVRDVQRSADFNQDGRVNSIDYACMRQNINQSDEEFSPPTAKASPVPTESPVVSPSPSVPPISAPIIPSPSPSSPAGGPSGILPFRVSFDPNFTTIAQEGDFGTDATRIISLTLPEGPGVKSVYMQFLEEGTWGPTPPQTASILLE